MPPAPPVSWREGGVALAACVLLSFAVFGMILPDYFLPEDVYRIHEGVDFVRTLSPRAPLTYDLHEIYRPGYFTWQWALHAVFGFRPRPYHVVSIVLHALAGALAYRLARRLLGGALPAALVTLAFMVNAVQRNLVFQVSLHIHLLSEVLALAAVLVWMRYVETGRARLAVAGLVVFWVAALNHVNVIVVLPAMAWLAVAAAAGDERWWRRPERWLGRVLLLGAYLVPVVALGLLEQARHGAIRRYTFAVVDAAKNAVVFTSSFYYPFEPFGLTAAVVPAATPAARLAAAAAFLRAQPVVLVMPALSLVTAAVVVAALRRGALAARVGALIVVTGFALYLPYEGVSLRYLGFTLIGMGLIVAAGVGRLPAGRGGRAARAVAVALLLLFVAWHLTLLRRDHARYARMARHTAVFGEWFARESIGDARRLVLCDVPREHAEAFSLAASLAQAAPSWLGRPDLDVRVDTADCAGPVPGDTVRLRFEEPGTIRRDLR